MNAEDYKSITGLTNYYGFKSLLKNGTYTSRYSCDDDTIVFNRIQTITKSSGLSLLQPNQAAVVLNFSSGYSFTAGLVFPNAVYTWDENFQYRMIIPNQIIYGQVFVYGIDFNTFGTTSSLTFAIFDLY